MTLLWSFDPGQATGWAVGSYGPNTPYKRINAGIIPGAAQGLKDWWGQGSGSKLIAGDTVVSESFTLNSGNEFVADTTPREVEGALIVLWDGDINWQSRAAKAGVPDDLLKAHNLWLTGKDVDWEDGRDANDATIHALEYLRRKRHLPTLRHYFRED